MTEIEDNLEDHIQGYGLRLNDDRKWWQPQFEVVALTCIHAGGVHMDQKEVHVSWHWTFRKGRTVLEILHAALVTKAMQSAWYGSMVRDPDAPPQGFEGTGL